MRENVRELKNKTGRMAAVRQKMKGEDQSWWQGPRDPCAVAAVMRQTEKIGWENGCEGSTFRALSFRELKL